MANQLKEFIIENDPQKERAEIFERNLQTNLSPYEEIYKDLQKNNKQTSIKNFFKPTDIISESDKEETSDFE